MNSKHDFKRIDSDSSLLMDTDDKEVLKILQTAKKVLEKSLRQETRATRLLFGKFSKCSRACSLSNVNERHRAVGHKMRYVKIKSDYGLIHNVMASIQYNCYYCRFFWLKFYTSLALESFILALLSQFRPVLSSYRTIRTVRTILQKSTQKLYRAIPHWTVSFGTNQSATFAFGFNHSNLKCDI